MILLAAAVLLSCVSSPEEEVTFHGTDLGTRAATLLAQSIRIPTVNPPGDERPLAELYEAALASAGLEARVVHTPSGRSEVGRALVWGRYAGTGAKRPVVLLSHLDVVPAIENEWTVPPFEGVVGGGYVIGRGALDSKGVAVVHLLTLAELARREVVLERDVIFLATPDEELGGQLGSGFLVRERPELLAQAEYLLTEGGGILDGPPGAPPVWGITVTEKSPCWIRVTAHGAPGHSSTAGAQAATHRLVKALARLDELETEVRVLPEVAAMFEALAPLYPRDERRQYRRLARSLEEDPDFRETFLRDPARNALVRDTVTITVLEGGPRTNVMSAEAHAELDARLLPDSRCDDFVESLAARFDDPAIHLEPILSLPSRTSPFETELVEAIQEVAARVDPEAVVVPRVIPGFTDAHYFRELGIVAYGFVPRWLPPHETRGIHGPNERISIENLERSVETLVAILEEFAGR